MSVVVICCFKSFMVENPHAAEVLEAAQEANLKGMVTGQSMAKVAAAIEEGKVAAVSSLFGWLSWV